MNAERFTRVLEYIKDHPKTWDQRLYKTEHEGGCDTAYCFIGWAAVMALNDGSAQAVPFEPVWVTASRWLSITRRQEEWLCNPYNKIADFERFLAASGDIPEGQ